MGRGLRWGAGVFPSLPPLAWFLQLLETTRGSFSYFSSESSGPERDRTHAGLHSKSAAGQGPRMLSWSVLSPAPLVRGQPLRKHSQQPIHSSQNCGSGHPILNLSRKGLQQAPVKEDHQAKPGPPPQEVRSHPPLQRPARHFTSL